MILPFCCYFDWYLFQLIVLLKHDFSSCNSFALPLYYIWKFCISVIENFVTAVAEEIYSAEQVRMILILHLIKCISRVLQKLLKYFNCNAISPSFVLPQEGVFSVNLIFDLNDSDFLFFYFIKLFAITQIKIQY